MTIHKMTKASRAEVIAINEKLKETLTLGPDGIWQYDEGWSDEVVARSVGIKPSTVANARLDLYGKIRKHTRQASISDSRRALALVLHLYERLGEEVPF